ncbi:hypothetical protein [Planotetraspora kaengkrachanensis]|uniref:Uncharacterized protein n=1 Tax=Planotetraspora kaengkrachanensis TaxID=575193 RepID=A0A8J3PZY8_9ACTN|nr:hypothetical protein [Planotetraspora kaengkrachanensis]GIG84195.1 hypothetical protein Pka01_73220 [Planotetraspora kaengkrachanensis]
MPICTAVLAAALLAGPAASPADPVPAAHKSLANKTTKQQTPDKIEDRDAIRRAAHKAVTPATRADDDDPRQESSASSDSSDSSDPTGTGDSDSGHEEASFQKSESWSSDPHAGGDSQVRATQKARKAGNRHHGKNSRKVSAPRGEEAPGTKGAAHAPAAPAAGPAHAPVIEPAVASAAKPAVVPAVKQAPVGKQASTVKHAPAGKQAPLVKHALVKELAPLVRHAPVKELAPLVKQAPVGKQAPAVKHAPEPRPALAPAVEVPKIAAEAPLAKKAKVAEPTTAAMQKIPAPKDADEIRATRDFDSTEAAELDEFNAAPEAVALPEGAAGTDPRDVMINPSGMAIPKNPYILPAMPGLQRSIAKSHFDHGRHTLRHPHHQRGHAEA